MLYQLHMALSYDLVDFGHSMFASLVSRFGTFGELHQRVTKAIESSKDS